jgi:uncharacterized membrane protein
MTAAQNEDGFRGRLAVEVDAWQRERLITAEQGAAILARYQLRPAAARAVRLGPVAMFVSIVGSIAFGVGVVLFFAANWEALPAWSKVLLVFGATGSAYAAGSGCSFARACCRVWVPG